MVTASKKKDEGNNLIQRDKSDWTRKDRLLLLFFVLIEVGNGVEIYLPGNIVITILSQMAVQFCPMF